LGDDEEMTNSPVAKILVADDEPVVRHLLAQSLGGQGFEVLLAETGSAAFALVKKNPPSLVLTDINMPDGDGVQLVQWLSESEHKDIPVILMTGDLDQIESKSLTGAIILRKPFRRREVVELINSVLGRSTPPA